MARLFRFDCFEVDPAAHQLFKRGARIRLRDQSFQVLMLLLERPGHVVTRDDLRRRLWPGDVFVDFENSLNTAVGRLREALGDSADQPRYVETVPRVGYRFLAAVAEVWMPEPPATPAPKARLVVLPFVNLSGDPSQEYFSDAMTDEIITELSGLAPAELGVIARTTTMHYKGCNKDVAQIGRELRVDYVVEGGVRRTQDQIALTVQLVRPSDQTQVFAKRYQAELRDIFSIHSSIARDVAEHINVGSVAERIRPIAAPGARERRKPTNDPAAYDEYLQGRHQLAHLTPEAFSKARQHLEEAIARDRDFALAYDSLAEIYWYLGYLGFMAPRDAFSTGVLYAMARSKSTTHSAKHTRSARSITSNWSTTGRKSTGKWRVRSS
jgi:TolB-like protein